MPYSSIISISETLIEQSEFAMITKEKNLLPFVMLTRTIGEFCKMCGDVYREYNGMLKVEEYDQYRILMEHTFVNPYGNLFRNLLMYGGRSILNHVLKPHDTDIVGFHAAVLHLHMPTLAITSRTLWTRICKTLENPPNDIFSNEMNRLIIFDVVKPDYMPFALRAVNKRGLPALQYE